jgi:phage/plasmid-associated DNA primase
MDDSKEKNSIMKKIKAYEKQVGKGIFITNITKVLDSAVDLPWLHTRMDKYPDVLGVENGIVELNIARTRKCEPLPRLITGYSKYFITKSTRANYKPYDKNDEYCIMWKNIFREIIPEQDARRVIRYILSTGCDQACKMIFVTQLRGGGSNGKSVLIDNIMHVLGPEISTKLSSNLLLDKVKGGAADNDLMLMEGRNIGFICETDEGDTIVSSRLKTINEEFKTGRKNYRDQKNFEVNCTVVIATNNALDFHDTDFGSYRRMITYEMQVKFCAKPNPKYPNEKKSNKKYETLAKDVPEAADSLLSYLIHKRIRFHQLYNSDIEQVDMPTINHYTEKYKKEQNKMYNFLCQRIVLLKGYQPDGEIRDDHTKEDIEKYYFENDIDFSHSIDLNKLIDEYKKWFETVGKIGNKSNDSIKREFLESKIKNNIKPIDDGRYYEIPGYRVLQGNKKKLPEEGYFI